jgi:hypothetical protein
VVVEEILEKKIPVLFFSKRQGPVIKTGLVLFGIIISSRELAIRTASKAQQSIQTKQ